MHKLIAKLRGDKSGKHSDEERESRESSEEKSDSDVDAIVEEMEDLRLDPRYSSLEHFEKRVILGMDLPFSPASPFLSIENKKTFIIKQKERKKEKRKNKK
jgi:hypothetical protein